MGSRLAVEINEIGEISVLKLVGIIDEDNDLNELTVKVNQPQVVIDVSRIERINSCGVRDWVNWLSDLRAKGVTYTFAECSPAIMNQANAVGNFVGGGVIASFYAPYYCSHCKSDKMLRIDPLTLDPGQELHAPACRCDDCDRVMDFDDIESSYFAVISAQLRDTPTVAPAVLQVVEGLSGSSMRSPSVPSSVSTPMSISDTPARNATAPDSAALRSLLTDSGASGSGPRLEAPKGSGFPRWLLVMIAVMLLVAVGLIAVVVVRSL